MLENDKADPGAAPRSAPEIQEWIVSRIATRLQTSPSSIRIDEPVVDIGLDSMEFVALIGELEQWLDCRFRANPLISYPTIASLSEFLAGEIAAGRKIIAPGGSS